MKKLRVFIILGTRPEAIKLAILYKILKQISELEVCLCFTGQHIDLTPPVLKLFGIEPDFILDLKNADKSMSVKLAEMLVQIEGPAGAFQPDWILVQGDTLSAYAGAQYGFLNGISVAHIEAGLRSGKLTSPYPEEIFRRFIDAVAELHFAPSRIAADNLKAEGINNSTIHVTGNTGKDAFLYVLNNTDQTGIDTGMDNFIEAQKNQGRSVILLTMHRRESLGPYWDHIADEIQNLLHKNNHAVIYIGHPHPASLGLSFESDRFDNFISTGPVRFDRFVLLLNACDLVLTDSGGVQEEAAYLGLPTMVLRSHSERDEIIRSGSGRLYGGRNLELEIVETLDSHKADTRIYGDGKASERIAEVFRTLAIGQD